MTSAARAILDDALRLSPAERAELVEELLRSFDQRPDAAMDAAWAAGADARIDAYAGSRIAADPAESVFARIARR